MLVLRERDHAVADVTGRKHVELFTEATRGATVISDGDDSREAADEAGDVGLGGDGWPDAGFIAGRGARRGNITLEPSEEGGETGASTDRDDSELAGIGSGSG
jgi:hypothetical protein